MVRSTRHIMVAFLVSMVIVLVIGGDAFQPAPTFSMWWPNLLLEGVAGVVALASFCTMAGRFVDWLPGALR